MTSKSNSNYKNFLIQHKQNKDTQDIQEWTHTRIGSKHHGVYAASYCIPDNSIDNFYKTHEERNKMSNKVHPLFITRGVPGTHDINLVKNFFDIIRRKKFKKIQLPKFEKAIDNRLKKKYWFNIKKNPK